MKLYEFLKICDANDYVGIWNVDASNKERRSLKRFETCPPKQSYSKVGNIPYGRIADYLDMDVLHINHNEKGILIRIHNRKRLEESLNNYDIAGKITKAIKR